MCLTNNAIKRWKISFRVDRVESGWTRPSGSKNGLSRVGPSGLQTVVGQGRVKLVGFNWQHYSSSPHWIIHWAFCLFILTSNFSVENTCVIFQYGSRVKPKTRVTSVFNWDHKTFVEGRKQVPQKTLLFR